MRDRVRVYVWVGGDKPSDVYDGAAERRAQGFTAVKMNATEAVSWIDTPLLLEDTVARVREVKSLGLDVGIDFHGRLHKGMAKQLAKALEPLAPLFIEGNISRHCGLGYSVLTRSVRTAVAHTSRGDWGPRKDGVYADRPGRTTVLPARLPPVPGASRNRHCATRCQPLHRNATRFVRAN